MNLDEENSLFGVQPVAKSSTLQLWATSIGWVQAVSCDEDDIRMVLNIALEPREQLNSWFSGLALVEPGRRSARVLGLKRA